MMQLISLEMRDNFQVFATFNVLSRGNKLEKKSTCNILQTFKEKKILTPDFLSFIVKH